LIGAADMSGIGSIVSRMDYTLLFSTNSSSTSNISGPN
jgi:hypothetical protein